MIVMKFGGTSVGSGEMIRQVVEIVRQEQARRPMVVVSAASRITDLLLGAAQKAVAGGRPDELRQPVVDRQRGLLSELGLPADFVDDHLDSLLDVLKGVALLGELTRRSLDRIASYGERMSARVVARVMSEAGLAARDYPAWELGMRTDSQFGAARMLGEAGEAMRLAWAQLPRDVIPVVTGFIGQDTAGRITTLGRGGSDLSASLFGAALGAEEIQIWTDVSGIMTCDPRVVPEARILPQLAFDEAAELAYFGAKVLHPKTIEPAMRADIPVRVKNTFQPRDPGTVIVAAVDTQSSGPVGIAMNRNVTCVNLMSTGMLDASGFVARVFEVFARHNIPIDVISTSEVQISFTVVASEDALGAAAQELRDAAKVTLVPGRAVVCLVGEGMKTTAGLAGRVFSTLGAAGVNVEMISQGASEINVTFVIRNDDCDAAVRALHRHFFE
jgi:aspartate kinase